MKQRKNVMRVSAWNTIGRLLVAGCFAVVTLFLMGLISPDTSSAAVAPPNKMNFQGRLTDASGNPLTGTYDMQFKLYSAASGGTLLWAETRTAANSNAVTVTSGLFSVRLGEGTLVAPSTQLSAVVAANSTLYFEITIGSDAAMTPRSQLATSAYAFNSDTLDGIDSSGFIQNTTTQQTANFNISGTGQAATFQASTSVISTLFDTGSVTALNIGTTNATVINLNKNVTVAAGKTLTLAGGTTASRPASPAEGALYYDTSTKQLVVYANGKWQADRTTSTKIVAASNAPQALKDGADYVATGSGDEATINTALAAAAGGKVYLTEGTYTISDSISVPNDTILAGAGAGTVITFPNGFSLDRSAIVNMDTSTGTGMTIRDLTIDGNNANISIGNGNGIYLTGVGSDTSGSVRAGAIITNVIINNLHNGASLASTIALDGTYNTNITNSTLGSGNLYIRGSHNIVSNNYIFDSQQVGIYVDGPSSNNTISSNSIQNTELWGIYMYNAYFTTVSGNRITNAGGSATNDAIYLDASDNNTITNNTVDDNSATTNNYAINIAYASADNNYVADNNIWGSSVNDAGTGTIYGGQVTSATGSYLLKPAGTINLSQDVTVAAGKSLTLAGGNTASRPASPTEGMLYYDTTTKQLLTYSNGKWQADRSTSTKIVAASNASQALKDGADYVATGSGDQTIINNALTAAAGGKVYLTEGTYTINGSINVPNNTMLAGSGYGTLITVANSFNTAINAITNTTTGGNGTGVGIQDLRLDGNKANQTAGSMYGIYFNGVGSGSGSAAVQGGKITNIWTNNWRNSGIYVTASSNNMMSGITVQGNTSDGIVITTGSSNNTLTGSIMQGNGASGVYVISSTTMNNTFTGNTSQANNNAGFYINNSSADTLTGNTIQGNAVAGIYLFSSANSNVIAGNSIANSGGSTTNNGIFFNASDSNTVTGNTITDSGATTTNYAINVSNNTSDTNYLANNTLGGGSINDVGTGTVYGGQVDGSNNYILQPAGYINLLKGTNIIMASVANDTSVSNLVVSSGADATLGPLSFSIGTHPSATAANRYAFIGTGDTMAMRDLVLNTNGAGAFGNVAIGTTSAGGYRLNIQGGDVNLSGNLGMGGNLYVTGNANIYSGNDINTYASAASPTDPGDIVMRSNDGTERARVYSDSSNINKLILRTNSSANVTTIMNTSACTIGSGTGTTACTSDIRKKNIVGNLTNNLEKIMQLQPVSFTWKSEAADPQLRIGLIAQNVQTQFPEAVTTDADGFLQLDYSALVSPLIGAVQEQQAEIAGVKASITDLQASRSAGASLSASSLDAVPSAALTIGGTNATAVNIGRTTENIVTTITGTTIIKPSSGHNSTSVFQVQNAASSSLFTVDSTNNRLYIGSISGDTTGVTLVLGNKTTAGDPAGVDGAMYYNSYMGAFRCYSNGAWSNCGDDNIDSSWKTEEEFMSGQSVSGDSLSNGAMTWATSSLNWAYMKIGNGGVSGFSYNPTITGLTTTTNHPGLGVFSSATSNVGANIALDGGSDGSLATTQDTTFKTQLHNSHSAGLVERAGLFDYQPNLVAPSSGAWWEANPAVSPYWRYCYNNTATQICADSTVLIAQSSATDGWVKLEIRTGKVATTGNASSVAFYINGSLAANLTGINIQKDGHDAPNVTFYSTDSISKQLAVDYVLARGTISR